jgi:peptide/nickel transport system permease protein
MRFKEYFLMRVVQTFVTLFIVIVLLFVVFRLMPGDPSMFLIDPKMTPEAKKLLRINLGLDKPMWEQFVIYLQNTLTLNFGTSFTTHQPVAREIAERLPTTLLLFGTAHILGTILSILIGILMAWYRGSKMEISGIVVSLFFYSMPLFWFGLILLVVFYGMLHWFPVGGLGGLDPATNDPLPFPNNYADVLWHMTLPMFNLMVLGLAGGILLMRNSMLEVMGEDYITTARAKGLSESKVMTKHAARNALLPVVTSIAMGMAGMVSGGVLTETVFSWPGMGAYLVQRTLSYDYPAVQGAFFMLAIITIIANWVADILYAYLDPRIRL